MSRSSCSTSMARVVLDRSGVVAALVVALGWLRVLLQIASHRIFVTHDTLISYAHVWYVSRRLWHDHVLPVHMPTLGHGAAFAFPYGLVPWLTAAAVRPLIGDRAVTLWLVLGVIGVVVATIAAFPELRRGWWTAAVLLNPALIAGALSGQVPFLWGATLLLLAMACWRRGSAAAAVLLAAAAQITHIAVLGPIALAVVLGRARWDSRAARLLKAYAVSAVIALPAAYFVFASPVFEETSMGAKLTQLVETVGPRSLVVIVPIVALWLQRRPHAMLMGPLFCVALVAITGAGWLPQDLDWSWRQLDRAPDSTVAAFVRSAAFEPGRTYRYLRLRDGKVGMYQLLRGGASLDSEFFPESMMRRSFGDPGAYSRALRARRVDVVMLFANYRRLHTDEPRLLSLLASRPQTHCAGPWVCISIRARHATFVVYDITRG